MRLISTVILFTFLFGCGETQSKSTPQSIDIVATSNNRQTKVNMFDPKKLTESDKKILADFYTKRKLFDTYIKENGLKLFTCPGCSYPTLNERGSYEICDVCNWEDDYQDDKDADKVWGGPNGKISLTENRINIGKILFKNADSLKSSISTDPLYVLNTIKGYKKKKLEIANRMTGNETLEHPIWTEWNQVEKDLQIALCRDNH